MTFLDFEIDEKDLAAAKFIGETRRGLIAALLEAKKSDPSVCQASLARKIKMDKASLSKILNGKSNFTLRTIAEIAWALNVEPEVHFCHPEPESRDNLIKYNICGAPSREAKYLQWGHQSDHKPQVKVKPSTQSLRISNVT